MAVISPRPLKMIRKWMNWMANAQGLIEVIEVLPTKANWFKFELCTQKYKYPNAFVECFIQSFQRLTAPNREALEHRNLFISLLGGNFPPDIKRQIQNIVVGCTSQALSITIEAATQFFEDSLQKCQRINKGGKIKFLIYNFNL